MGKKVLKDGETAHGTVIMVPKENSDMTSFSYNDEEYEVDAKGEMEIPLALVALAESHNFVRKPAAKAAAK